jgi:hypothetical protein
MAEGMSAIFCLWAFQPVSTHPFALLKPSNCVHIRLMPSAEVSEKRSFLDG